MCEVVCALGHTSGPWRLAPGGGAGRCGSMLKRCGVALRRERMQ
jgi:hypothetical protein